MSLENVINTKIKEAMLAKKEADLRTYRAIKSAILLEKTSGNHADGLTEEAEMKMLRKMAKQRKDSIMIFEEQGRDDLAVREKEELGIIESFLPKPLDDSELETALRQIMEKVGAASLQDMGKMMGAATKELAGKADGKRISEMVKSLLSP